jgi:hypothetical protein
MVHFRGDYFEPEAAGDFAIGGGGDREDSIVQRSIAISLKRLADCASAREARHATRAAGAASEAQGVR